MSLLSRLRDRVRRALAPPPPSSRPIPATPRPARLVVPPSPPQQPRPPAPRPVPAPPEGRPAPGAFNEYHKGPRSNFSTKRDPLAVAFDRAADALVQRAITAQGMWVQTIVHTPESARFDRDQDGLTCYERAFLQACYYHRRIYMWGGGSEELPDGRKVRRRNPARTHSLKREWGGHATRGQYSGRVLKIRALRVGEASLYAKEQGWTG